MRFRKKCACGAQRIPAGTVKTIQKEITMSKDELRELEKWVASGRSPMITETIFIAKTDAQWTLSAQCVSRMKCMNGG